ncbi:MAG: hypothetical protein D3913_14545 [Candidatus Electrothrix sp. LOE1_4_5]|nr:hypothetical protein [Candidatus Electrothrix gigas]
MILLRSRKGRGHRSRSNKEAVERGFRSVFRGFEGFEQMVRTCRYPRVLVSPLLVYRQMGGGR